jgi:hypothetical protein
MFFAGNGFGYLVRSDTCAKGRPNDLGIDVLRQLCQEFGIKHTVLLETAVFMVQMVC